MTCYREITPKRPARDRAGWPRASSIPTRRPSPKTRPLPAPAAASTAASARECHACVDICPADCIDLNMKGEEIEVEVDAVVLATGYTLFPAELKPQYGYGKYKNVITGMQMDRLLAPTRPYNARGAPGRRQGARQHRLHPLHRLPRRDPRQPALLAHLLHVLRQAQPADHGRAAAGRRHRLLHGHPHAGQGLRRVLRAGQGHGRQLREGPRGRASPRRRTATWSSRYEDIENGTLTEAEHDLVVLAVGVRPNDEARPRCSPTASWRWTTTPTWAKPTRT